VITLNCIELAVRHARDKPHAVALWVPRRRSGGSTTFGELLQRTMQMQQTLLAHGTGPGATVLLVDGLGPRLYATVLAVLSLGASVMLVEPWMPVSKIELAIRMAKPVLYITNWLGRCWGLRIPSVRAIGTWLSAASLDRAMAPAALHIEPVEPDSHAILTFTSGTTGTPKGVIRSHGNLIRQHEVLCDALRLNQFSGSDLCILANFVLANLASGRSTILVPPAWRTSHLRLLDALPAYLKPETLTCGPGFLLQLMRTAWVESLKSIHIGGALTDCWIYETGFARWPDAEWSSVYGSSEAEPVATCDARLAVAKSRAQGYFQTLYLGRPVPAIESDPRADGLWVTGPHVCPLYLGDIEANRLHKRRDPQGRVWHFMGDRIRIAEPDDGGWWYAGRASQQPDDFALEQNIYSLLQSSKAFVHRRANGEIVLVGENVSSLSQSDAQELAAIDSYVDAKIYRDARHRARIDRQKTLRKGATWLLG
jgi:acyl-coenzyme A synthetase/AMP-(fatty) acid ligase